ncbi:hypothetical protein JCM21142_3955 [Saccharicrinis fermentans DSM 9555 = JCM 21142]|uniref:ABC-type transport system n=2 Tax=Saccharicrinis fermentans TaxID=982 RepID=W7YCY9_9BACT|nr:hypothetical protein JCM21142_3955 [Saccharicrinis fermentans DSM 9555 = JCM 21142]
MIHITEYKTLDNYFMKNIIHIIKYNLKIIFGNRFVYFLGASLIFYLLFTGIALFSGDMISVEDVYYQLIFPGILLIFFPTAFGIQNDEDARILEILFGIPNYRYKVWLVRLSIIFVMVFVVVTILAFLNNYLLVELPVLEMGVQLMTVLILFGTLGFLFSTMVKNGNGTAVVMVIVGLALWFLHGFMGVSKWNVFLNPFLTPTNISESVFQTMLFQNRLIIVAVSVVSVLWGLINLQGREGFIK